MKRRSSILRMRKKKQMRTTRMMRTRKVTTSSTKKRMTWSATCAMSASRTAGSELGQLPSGQWNRSSSSRWHPTLPTLNRRPYARYKLCRGMTRSLTLILSRARIHAKSSLVSLRNCAIAWRLSRRIELIARLSVTRIRFCIRRANCVTWQRYSTQRKRHSHICTWMEKSMFFPNRSLILERNCSRIFASCSMIQKSLTSVYARSRATRRSLN